MHHLGKKVKDGMRPEIADSNSRRVLLRFTPAVLMDDVADFAGG